MWNLLFAQTDPPNPLINGSIVNWIVCALVGLLVWLVKRLVDNNQKILDSMKSEAAEERKLHREDIRAITDEGQKNRIVTELGFDKLAEAITKLSDKIKDNQ